MAPLSALQRSRCQSRTYCLSRTASRVVIFAKVCCFLLQRHVSGDCVPNIITVIAPSWKSYGVAANANGSLLALTAATSPSAYWVKTISPAGVLQPLAGGNGTQGMLDAVNGTSGMTSNPTSIAYDPRLPGFVFADTAANRIRALFTNGTLQTLIGSGATGRCADGTPPLQCSMSSPQAVAVDLDSSRTFFAGFSYIQVLNASGVFTLVAGFSDSPSSVPLASAGIGTVLGLAWVSASRTLLVADSYYNKLRGILPNGTMVLLAGNGSVCTTDEGADARTACLSAPTAVAHFPGSGSSFILEYSQGRIRQLDASGRLWTVVGSAAGVANFGFFSTNLTGGRLNGPRGIALLTDPAATAATPLKFAVTETAGGAVRIIDCLHTAEVLAAIPSVTPTSSALPAVASTTASLTSSASVTAFPSTFNETAYVAAGGFAGGTINTIVGNGSRFHSGDGSPPRAATLVQPWGIAIDDALGLLFVSDAAAHVIRRVAQTANVIETIAGHPFADGYTGDGGPAAGALLNAPRGLCYKAAAMALYVAEYGSGVLRVLENATGAATIRTLGGAFAGATAVACSDATPFVYVAVEAASCVFQVGPTGGTGLVASAAQLSAVVIEPMSRTLYFGLSGSVHTVDVSVGPADTLFAGAAHLSGAIFGGDGGPATSALLNGPTALALTDNASVLFVADTVANGRGVIRAVNITSAGHIITTIAGRCSLAGSCGLGAATNGDGGPAFYASLTLPSGVAFSAASGSLYVVDSADAVVCVITRTPSTVPSVNASTTPSAAGSSAPSVSVTAASPTASNTAFFAASSTAAATASATASANRAAASPARATPAAIAAINVDNTTRVSAINCEVFARDTFSECLQCAPGHYYSATGSGSVCAACPASVDMAPLLRAALIFAGALAAAAAAVLALAFVAAKAVGGTVTAGWQRVTGLLIQMLLVLQLFAQVGRTASPGLPPVAAGLLQSLTFLQFEDVSTPAPCWRQGGYAFAPQVGQMGVALGLSLLLWCGLLIPRRHGPSPCAIGHSGTIPAGCQRPSLPATHDATDSKPRLRTRCSDTIVWLSFTCALLTFALVVNTAFGLVSCVAIAVSPLVRRTLDADASPSEASATTVATAFSVRVLAANPTYVCYEGAHRPAAVVAWVTIAAFVVAFPIWTWLWVRGRIIGLVVTALRGELGIAPQHSTDGALAAWRALGAADETHLQHQLRVRGRVGKAELCCCGRERLMRGGSGERPALRKGGHETRVVAGSAAQSRPSPASPQSVHGAAALNASAPGLLQVAALDSCGAVIVDPLLKSFVGTAYRASGAAARQAQMVAVAALAALQAFWLRPATPEAVAGRCCSFVLILCTLAWWIGTRRPFHALERWKLWTQVGTLLLSALAAVLTHVGLAMDLEAAASGGSQTPEYAALDRARTGLAYLVVAGCVLLAVVLVGGFCRAVVNGARREDNEERELAAARREFIAAAAPIASVLPLSVRPKYSDPSISSRTGAAPPLRASVLLRGVENPLARSRSDAFGAALVTPSRMPANRNGPISSPVPEANSSAAVAPRDGRRAKAPTAEETERAADGRARNALGRASGVWVPLHSGASASAKFGSSIYSAGLVAAIAHQGRQLPHKR